MTLPMYLRIEGEKQGLITKGASSRVSIGNFCQEGIEDWAQVWGGHHHHVHASSPEGLEHFNDAPDKGLSLLTIRKHIDKSSPLLAMALNCGEKLKECRLNYYRYTDNGAIENYYTTTLRGARLVSYRLHFETEDEDSPGICEDLTFAYNRIEERHHAAGTTGICGWDDSVYTLNQPKPQPEAQKTTQSSGVLDKVQEGLDVAGLIPGLGIVPDIINAGISEARGDHAGAALAMATAIPFAGDAAGAAKLARDGEKLEKAAKLKLPLSSYEERIKQTPTAGVWEGERGESKFFSNKPEVTDFHDKGIEYRNGYPDFTPLVKHEVKLDRISADRATNFKKADEMLANKLGWSRQDVKKMRKAEGLTWHEVEDMETMQLMPSKPHSKLGHFGGVGEAKRLEQLEKGGQ